MRFSAGRALLGMAIGIATMTVPLRVAHAQDAEIITMIGREIVEALGKDAAEFGGEAVARQTAERLVAEATESAGSVGGQLAKAQVERVLASGKQALIFDLKDISGEWLPLLNDVTDEVLPAAIGTLARPGVGEGIQSLSSIALRKAALAGEIRLPGAGLRLVEHYGEEGAQLVARLGEDQANSLLAGLRPNAINSLPSAERSKLLNALVSRPDARVFSLNRTTGPLMVVAGGVVLWHGIDVTLAADQRVTERPDGTVIRETTSIGSRAVESLPATVRKLSTPLKWAGVTFAVGVSLVAGVLLRRRQTRRKPS